MFFTVVADQRLHDGLFTSANARVMQLSQFKRIAYSGQDCVHDRQASGSIEIADDVMNLQIHLHPMDEGLSAGIPADPVPYAYAEDDGWPTE